MTTIRLAGSAHAWSCATGDTVLRSALRAGIGMSYSCNVGSCGNCRFELLSGEVAHQREAPPAWTEKDRARNRFLGGQAQPAGDCTINFRPDPAAALPVRPALREGVLVSARPLNHDITEFAFRVTGDPAFLPGQYALLAVPGVAGARVYSMSGLPEDGLWSFIIRNACCVHRNMPVRFVSTTARHVSSGRSSIGTAGAPRPALLKSRSSRP